MKKNDFGKKCEELHVKAKMRNIYEEKFWKGMSIEHIDSVKRRNLENIGMIYFESMEEKKHRGKFDASTMGRHGQ